MNIQSKNNIISPYNTPVLDFIPKVTATVPSTFYDIIQQEIKRNTNSYMVPMKRTKAGETIHLHSVIPSTTPQRAMYLAQREFGCDGWIIDENYSNYKII